ncbi:MAG: c-type cytochrome [Deltaproteobacteria bacterium]|nr:MAG: c-type cytochrome [Deltaproteobacteria bacterium]
MNKPTPISNSHPKNNTRRWIVGLCFVALLSGGILLGCGSPYSQPEPGEQYAGGSTTVFDLTRNAFANTLANMKAEHKADFFVGNSFFNSSWVTAPASTEKRDGLGPLFNAHSCSGCHFKDGRGQPPTEPNEPLLSMLLRLSIPGKGPNGGPNPEPSYGGQLQTRSILGVKPEGNVSITYEEIPGTFADGEAYSLRKPTYTFKNLAYGPMHKDVLFSPRVAPPVFGLGLLQAIPEQALLAQADPDDKDGDGISGRPNQVWNAKQKKTVMGRFGWKANQPNLEQQTSGAFLGDIGITSPMFPSENCTKKQTLCSQSKSGGTPEVPEEKIRQVVNYQRLLAPPGRRDWEDPQVLRGKQMFYEAKCNRCHTPKFTTGTVTDLPELSNQTIYPYTDLLLHDMGEGLSDKRPDFEATGSEWRTPPLWGIGLTKTVNRHTFFLHDGRARNVQEAILWHGGEAKASQETFVAMPKADREALLAFLKSL